MNNARLSPKELSVMRLLVAEPNGLYGLEIVDRSKGEIKRGSVYVLLDRLEDKGFVTLQRSAPPKNQGGMPRPVYSPTSEGARTVAAYDILDGVMA